MVEDLSVRSVSSAWKKHECIIICMCIYIILDNNIHYYTLLYIIIFIYPNI